MAMQMMGAAAGSPPYPPSLTQSNELQALMQHVDWCSLHAVSVLLASTIADPDHQPHAATVLWLVLGDHGGSTAAAEPPNSVASNGTPSRTLVQLMRETMMDAFRRLELAVHPCLGDSVFCPVAAVDRAEEAAPAAPSDVNPLVCPLCLAAAVGRDDCVSQFMASSRSTHRHAVIAARTALWNHSLASATVLCQIVLRCGEALTDSVLERDRGNAIVAHGAETQRIEGARLVPFVTAQLHWVAAGMAVLGDANVGGNVVEDTEDILLGALSTLFASCGTDNDTKQLVALLAVNLPQPAANAGTLVHAMVRAKAHACLRFVLEQCRLSTVAQRRSLKSCARLAALRYDALNRRDAHGATPLSVAIALHDATSARLLLLHGASAHARAKVRAADVALQCPLDLLHRHRCGTDLLRLFYPTALEGEASRKVGSLSPPRHPGEVPSFEAVEDSLQQSMEGFLSRSSVGEILMHTAQRLLQHVATLKQSGDAALRRASSVRETALRTMVAALHADPWNAHVAQELVACLHREAVEDTSPSIHRRVALHMHRMLSATSGAMQGVYSTTPGPPKPYDSAGVPATEALYDGPYLLCREEGGNGVVTLDRRKWDEEDRGRTASPAATVVTHVKVLCPISCLPPAAAPSAPPAAVGNAQPPPCFVLWVRLSPLLGNLHPDDVALDLTEGHGFVEGCTAPGCPMQGGDLIFFAKSSTEHATMFVVTRCVQEGAVKVPPRQCQQTANPVSVTLRRVRVGAWAVPEDALQYPDPTMWMEGAKTASFFHQVGHSAMHWKQLNAHVLRAEGGHASFWAVHSPNEQLSMGFSDAVVCRPLALPPSDPCFDPQFPWSIPHTLVLVNSHTEDLLGFLPLL